MKELTVAFTVHKGFESEPKATHCVFYERGIGGKRSSKLRGLDDAWRKLLH